MKNKTLKFVASALLIVIVFSSLSVSAWRPDYGFYIEVDSNKIPLGTEYIDLLLHIPATDDGYVSYNQSNGTEYNISPDSEIVNYCEDGYRSYTFHIVDAVSDMQASYGVSIYVEKTVYDEYKELLYRFDSTPQLLGERYYFSDNVYLGSDKENTLNEIEKTVTAEINKGYLCVQFNHALGLGQESAYDFEHCRLEYKCAKMAYLDKDGNVLAVSNTVEIDKKPNRSVQLGLRLSGQEFSSDVTTGPPVGLILIAFYAFGAPLFISSIIVVLIIIIKSAHKKHLHNHN